jgi:hypothetical protein
LIYPLSGWCDDFNKSFTVFTGLNVSNGTSTKMVVHFAIAPFHNPGSSKALMGFPFLVFSVMKAAFGSTNCVKSNFSPLKFFTPQTISTGLKCVASFAIFFCDLLFKSI